MAEEEETQAPEAAQETTKPEEAPKPADGRWRAVLLGAKVTPAESEKAHKLVAFAYELGVIQEKTMQALLLRGLSHVYNEVRQAYQELRDGRH